MGALLLDTLRANRFHTDVHVIHTVYLDAPGMEALGPIGMYIVARPRGRLYPLEPGITCGVSSWQRMPDQTTPFRAKSGGNYLNTRLGGVEARQHGYDAAIFLNTRGKVAEGGGACVFAIRKGVVITPSITSDILESITAGHAHRAHPRGSWGYRSSSATSTARSFTFATRRSSAEAAGRSCRFVPSTVSRSGVARSGR